ncbi:glycosyltransferase family 4 protein [Knoellia sp. p5-6-4]|uniref:glycosyltransferase family 4 protein n=1 Tax=unclassified Knoellia TaxID=2618719 RepID=UPI0023D9E8A3|nr:glycosyltransferase family 4 protein [Knoellia sp. p5-6-4]MDF2146453.1 glycosyltransferase family 4 protein [Knoellia sp. p5-6-4]
MSAAALRVAVVGPAHPYKGGVAAHTTTLAHELAEAGHDVTLVSWSHLYPSRLYPGEQAVPGGAPDVPPFPRTVRALSWARPDTWVRTGRRLRGFDAVVVVHVIPAVVPAHLAMLRAAGVGSRSADAPRSVVIAHNVLPHETHPGDRALVRRLFERVDAVLVHSAEQARLAHDLGAARVSLAELPPHLPGGAPAERPAYEGPTRLLALGIVREYKGVDLLMRALARVPGPTLTVAGEMWGEAGERVKALAQDPRLRDRVEVHSGYVPADRLAPLLASHDVLALTYRTATASQNVLLGLSHGLPVLASDVGTFGNQVRDGVDGLLVPPDDEDSLVAALERLADPSYAAQLRSAVDAPDLSGPWATYVGTLEALASSEGAAEDVAEEVAPQAPRPPLASLPARAVDRARRALAARRPALSLQASDLPEWIRATDVLADAQDADDARDVARRAGLPRCSDGIAAWAALGALAAIVRVRDDGRRSAVIVDESGSRSPLSRWVRAIGFAPVELDLTGGRSSVEVLDVDTASLDVIARLHPGGCDADDVDEAMSQASWALRSGGLLLLTLPIGPSGAEGALGPADVRGVLARAHDLGFVLVGDLDRDITERMRRAASASTSADAAYGLLRLTLRRR